MCHFPCGCACVCGACVCPAVCMCTCVCLLCVSAYVRVCLFCVWCGHMCVYGVHLCVYLLVSAGASQVLPGASATSLATEASDDTADADISGDGGAFGCECCVCICVCMCADGPPPNKHTVTDRHVGMNTHSGCQTSPHIPLHTHTHTSIRA